MRDGILYRGGMRIASGIRASRNWQNPRSDNTALLNAPAFEYIHMLGTL